MGRQCAGSVQVQGLPAELGPGCNHDHDGGETGDKPAQQAMEFDVPCLDEQNEDGHEEQPERGGNGMEMNDRGNRRALMKLVVEVEAEAHSNDDPESCEPDKRSPAIVARGPRCLCMHVH